MAFFSWHKDHEVVRRIGFLLIFLILFATCISIVYSYYLSQAHDQSLEIAKQEVNKISRNTIKVSVHSMAQSLGEQLRMVRAAAGSEEEVLRRGLATARYEDSGYYFAYDFDGVNIVHPFHPEFQGQPRLQITDADGFHYIAALTEQAAKGGGFVTYRFEKPEESASPLKTVYAERIPDTRFWLATGVYLDDIEQELDQISSSFHAVHRNAILTVGGGVALVLVCVVIPLSLMMINSILNPWRQMVRELRHAQKMEAIGIFAGGIAHDFGNVIGAISSCTELALYDTDKSSPVYEDLLHVLKAAKRGKSLVRRITEFSRQTDAPRQPVNISRVLHECMYLVRSLVPANIQVREEIRKRNVHVLADPDQILQIIMNLCTNAEQAMRHVQDGVLSVELDTWELAEAKAKTLGVKPGHFARLIVSDTGMGMKPQIMTRIFDPFYSTRKKSGGTGLGLSMTKGIVNLHGGGIYVESELGQGTAFTVLIPCEEYIEERTSDHLPDLPGGRESILVVDDDQDFLASTTKLLRRLGYKVEGKDDPRLAIDLFFRDPLRFDLIFSDQLMQGMTGSEMIATMREVRPDLPVLICSGIENRSPRQRIPVELQNSPRFLFFRKPFDTVDLCRGLRTLLDAAPGLATHTGRLP